MNKFLIMLCLAVSFAFGGDAIEGEVDCLIIKEENSIVCKYMAPRVIDDKFIEMEWIDPKGNVSRTKKVVMPSGHGSVYDFRYIQGRMPGVWTFRASDGEKSFETNFKLEK
jgi:hypothetical protein